MAIRYVRPFLSEVIVRLDVSNEISGIDTDLNPALVRALQEHFPILEPHDFIGVELQFGPDRQPTQQNRRSKEWHFVGINHDKRLIVSNDAIMMSYKKYDSSSALFREFRESIDAVYDAEQELAVSRLGLRYINRIELAQPDPTDWERYLDGRLLASLEIPGDKSRIVRAFHVLETDLGDMRLRFQYGMHNPDYPAVIRRKQFILDFDAYREGSQTRDELVRNLELFHGKIQELFEQSITDELRRIMNGGE